MRKDCLDEFGVRCEKWVQIVRRKHIHEGYFWCFKLALDAGCSVQIHLVLQQQDLPFEQLRSATERAAPGLADWYWKWIIMENEMHTGNW